VSADSAQPDNVAFPSESETIGNGSASFPFVPGSLHLLNMQGRVVRIFTEKQDGPINLALDFLGKTPVVSLK
jgi:hypothetical protein